MSTWTSPITWTASVLTVAQMNTEVRDHLNFLKGALDLITGSTTADTGAATYIHIVRATAPVTALQAGVTGDSVTRFSILADGTQNWGAGGASAWDTILYRSAANMLATDDGLSFLGASGITMGGNLIQWTERADPSAPAANDARLYVRDNGAGKTQLVIIFSSGAVQVIATQP